VQRQPIEMESRPEACQLWFLARGELAESFTLLGLRAATKGRLRASLNILTEGVERAHRAVNCSVLMEDEGLVSGFLSFSDGVAAWRALIVRGPLQTAAQFTSNSALHVNIFLFIDNLKKYNLISSNSTRYPGLDGTRRIQACESLQGKF